MIDLYDRPFLYSIRINEFYLLFKCSNGALVNCILINLMMCSGGAFVSGYLLFLLHYLLSLWSFVQKVLIGFSRLSANFCALFMSLTICLIWLFCLDLVIFLVTFLDIRCAK